MSNNKNLHIYKDNKVLEITLRWFRARAYFFAFFSIFWIGFLVVWYTIVLSSGAPAFALIVPLIHVAVGVGMGYYTLCLFLNKTYVDIDNGYLTVHHAPIPWWKGNKTIPIKDIRQLYVKEKVSKGKNGRSYSYILRAKTAGGRDEAILDINHASSAQMQEIEAELEAYLGIEDQPVATEYTRGRKPSKETIDRPRRHSGDFSRHPLNAIYASEIGSTIRIDDAPFEVASVLQYDWNDGNSDKLFQLTNQQYEEANLYLRQISGLLYAYQETRLSASQASTLKLNTQTPSANLHYQGNTYQLSRVLSGKKFLSGVSDVISIQQWLYLSEDNQSYIRILDEGGIISYKTGKKVAPDSLTTGLDLGQNPAADPLARPEDWGEEDFV